MAAMTMVVGFVCHDGVVIGADRQITGANYTYPECKINSLSWDNGQGIWGFSGIRDLQKEFEQEVWKVFCPGSVIESDQVAGLWKSCLETLKFRKGEALLTMFGYMQTGERPHLLMSTPERRVLPVDRAEIIGYADSPLARFFLGRIKSIPVAVTVQQAMIYAVDFISQAKKYDGQFVGDSIDVYSVDNSGIGGALCTRVLDAGQTGAWEHQINLAHYWMDVFFSELCNHDGKMINLQLFMERMDDFRRWLGGAKVPWPTQSDSQTSEDQR